MRKVMWMMILPFVKLYLMAEAGCKYLLKMLTPKKTTTYGEMYDKHKHDNKKTLIRHICHVTGLINGTPGDIDRAYYDELRHTSKRALLKALMLLNVAYTKKVQERKGRLQPKEA